MLSNINGYQTKDEWYIGHGSFGSVYKAEKNGNFFALKIFRSELLQTEYKQRIDAEIKALQKINHPNVVKIIEHGTYQDAGFEYIYIVMDLIEGASLSDSIGILDEDKCIAIITSIFTSLKEVHLSGILHRDLKPSNIMIRSSDQTPVILDFGLAKLIDYTSITQTGDRLGTYRYMSPEQITDSKNINELSDYYTVGVIFYELLTGQAPFDASNVAALIEMIKSQYPINPSDINTSISNKTENIVLRLLEKDPYKRFQSVDEVITALAETPTVNLRKLDCSTRNYIRLLHNEKAVFEEANTSKLIDRVIFPANFFSGYAPTVKIIRSSDVIFSTDPATNRLSYTAFSKTAGLLDLPYASGSPVKPIQHSDFSSITQIQNYVKKVVDYQIDNGVEELVAPFFYAKNSGDAWFNINIKLLKEAIDYRNQHYSDYPIWAGICMNVDRWHEDEEKKKILNNYVKLNADGYFVYGDPISNKSDLTQLFHYTDLLRQLQFNSNAPVVACRVNGLGIVLLSLGISGISSGIGSLDSFREDIISSTDGDYFHSPRYYISPLFGMISLKDKVTTKIKDLQNSSLAQQLICSCEYCDAINGGVLDYAKMKMHFLKVRKDELDEIAQIDPENRLEYIEAKLQTAIGYLNTLKKEGVKIGDFNHLKTWVELINQFKIKS